jgi:hypothetical protein
MARKSAYFEHLAVIAHILSLGITGLPSTNLRKVITLIAG